MSDYEKGFEAGKEWMRNEIARNPLALFDLLPTIAGTIQEQIKTASLTDSQNSIIQDALAGRIPHTELIEKLHNTMRNNA